MTETYGSTFNKWDWEQRAQERAEWQDQFTMCGHFRWHLKTDGCDCTDE